MKNETLESNELSGSNYHLKKVAKLICRASALRENAE